MILFQSGDSKRVDRVRKSAINDLEEILTIHGKRKLRTG